VIVKGEHSIIRDCQVGDGTSIWSFVNLFGCTIGRDCTIASFVEIGKDVIVGERCKIQSFAYIPSGVEIGDDVFIGPRVTFTNDPFPRATGSWSIVGTKVQRGASIGAGATIVCGVNIGAGAMVGAGAVVTNDVPDYAVVVGSPARVIRMCENE